MRQLDRTDGSQCWSWGDPESEESETCAAPTCNGDHRGAAALEAGQLRAQLEEQCKRVAELETDQEAGIRDYLELRDHADTLQKRVAEQEQFCEDLGTPIDVRRNAFRKGYAACEADVRAHLRGGGDWMRLLDSDEHRGAAARKDGE